VRKVSEATCIFLISLILILHSLPLPAQDKQKGREVFTRKELEGFNARTLSELLNALPGVSVEVGKVFIQGSSGKDVVVIIDGRRITDPSVKTTNLSGYWAEEIEKIEIVKGAGAAIYGDDTAGGVILITTRKEKRGISGTWEAFTDTYQRSQIRTKIVQKKISSAIGGTLQFTYYDQPKEYVDLWAIRIKNLFLEKKSDAGNKWAINLDAFYCESQPPGLTYAPTPNADAKGYDWNLTASFEKGALKSQTYYTGYGDDYKNPDINFRHQYLSQVLGETINYSLELPWVGKTPIGVTFEHYIITSNNFDTKHEPHGHLFVAKEWDLTQWFSLATGFRLSYYSAFGLGYNPEITLNFPLGKWALRASICQSHNIPSIHSRFYSSTYEKGNPDLKMERVNNLVFGLTFNPLKELSLSASGFYSHIDDAVTQTRYGEITTYENLATISRKGAEISLDIKPLSIFNVNLSYLYLMVKDEETQLYVIQKPKHTFKYTLNLKWKSFGLMHRGEWSSFYFSDSANTIKIPARYIGDIRLTYQLKECLAYIEITNFLNKHYEIFRGLPGQERIFRSGLQWNF